MKYLVRFVTYNTFEIEAKDEDEAFKIGEARFSNYADPLWDDFEVVESTEATKAEDKACCIQEVR